MAAQTHGIQPPPVEVHGRLAQGRYDVGVHRHVAGPPGVLDPRGAAHLADHRGHVLDHPGLIIGRHDRHQAYRRSRILTRGRERSGHRPEDHPTDAVDLQHAHIRTQLLGGGARGFQHRWMLDGGDHQSPAGHGARPAGDHQRAGLGAAGGQDHLMGVDPEGLGDPGARPGQQTRDPPARGVLGAGIGPPAQPLGQILRHLLGHLGADGAGGGVIEVGARGHASTLVAHLRIGANGIIRTTRGWPARTRLEMRCGAGAGH